jgi:hypothetical protein
VGLDVSINNEPCWWYLPDDNNNRNADVEISTWTGPHPKKKKHDEEETCGTCSVGWR